VYKSYLNGPRQSLFVTQIVSELVPAFVPTVAVFCHCFCRIWQ